MANIYVKLKSDGEIYALDCGEHKLVASDEVIVETEHSTEAGSIVPESYKIEEKSAGKAESDDKKKVIFVRKLSQGDRQKLKKLSAEAKTYLMDCQQKIEKYNLPMQLLDADLSFDEKKLTFYFTAPSRVDFRVLVSELAHTFKKIIRLQQIGSRDEARYLGGVGRCGGTICCKKFLKGNLESVTLDMASDQNLAQMGSNRITGVCGKLMCCLKYELDYYQKIKKTLPAVGTPIDTSKGKGTVVGQNIIKKSVSVKLNEGGNILEVDC